MFRGQCYTILLLEFALVLSNTAGASLLLAML